MNLKAQLAAAVKAAQDIIASAKADGRGPDQLTDDEVTQLEAKNAEIESLNEQITKAEKSAGLVARIGAIEPGGEKDGDEPEAAKTLGEHFVKSVGESGLSRVKSVSGTVIAAPEFKANTDTQAVPSSLSDFLTTFDRTVVRAYRRPTVSDLLGTGTIGAASNSVSYLVEGSVEGAIAAVAEGGAKPQLHMTDPTVRNDALKKIAGFLKFTDEMAEDADFWVSEINNRGLYLLSLAEEAQLLTGSGSGANVEGLLNRSGVQTEAAASVVDAGDDNANAIFRAMTKVQTATGLNADGIVINPADYQNLRLRTDANGQYYGGGYFAGQYGNGGVMEQPPIWGLRTVVSAAVSAGTVVVGAFGTAATVYRKGGVRVESTNSHASDFTSNLITTRIEERIALAVRIPAAFVDVTLDDNAPV